MRNLALHFRLLLLLLATPWSSAQANSCVDAARQFIRDLASGNLDHHIDWLTPKSTGSKTPPQALLRVDDLGGILSRGGNALVRVRDRGLFEITSRQGDQYIGSWYDPKSGVRESGQVAASTVLPVSRQDALYFAGDSRKTDPMLLQKVIIRDRLGEVEGRVIERVRNGGYVIEFAVEGGARTRRATLTAEKFAQRIKDGSLRLSEEYEPTSITTSKPYYRELSDQAPAFYVQLSRSERKVIAQVINALGKKGFPLTPEFQARLQQETVLSDRLILQLLSELSPFESKSRGAEYDKAAQELATSEGAGFGRVCESGAGVCLDLALLAHAVLAEYGIESSLDMGLVKDGTGVSGHAWVKTEDGRYFNGNETQKPRIYTESEYLEKNSYRNESGKRVIQVEYSHQSYFVPASKADLVSARLSRATQTTGNSNSLEKARVLASQLNVPWEHPVDQQFRLLFEPLFGADASFWERSIDQFDSVRVPNALIRDLKPHGELPPFEQRSAVRTLVGVTDGLLTKKVLDGRSGRTGTWVEKPIDGENIPFAILSDGSWVIGEPGAGPQSEIVLTLGKPVRAIGRIWVSEGRITLISDQVQYYRPSPRFMKQALQQMSMKGIRTDDIQVSFKNAREWISEYAKSPDAQRDRVQLDAYNEISRLNGIKPPPAERSVQEQRSTDRKTSIELQRDFGTLVKMDDWSKQVLDIVPGQDVTKRTQVINRFLERSDLAVVYVEHGYLAEGNKTEVFGHDRSTAMINAYHQAFKWTLDQPQFKPLKDAIGDNLIQGYKYIAYGLNPADLPKLTRIADEFHRTVAQIFESVVQKSVDEVSTRLGDQYRLPKKARFFYRAVLSEPGRSGGIAIDLAARKAKADRSKPMPESSTPGLEVFTLADAQMAYQKMWEAELKRREFVARFKGTPFVEGEHLSYALVSALRQALKKGRGDQTSFYERIVEEIQSRPILKNKLFDIEAAKLLMAYYSAIDGQTPVFVKPFGSESQTTAKTSKSPVSVFELDVSGLSARNFLEGERANLALFREVLSGKEASVTDSKKLEAVEFVYGRTRENLKKVDAELASEYTAFFKEIEASGLKPTDQVLSGDDARIELPKLSLTQKQELVDAASRSLTNPGRVRIVEKSSLDLDSVAKQIQDAVLYGGDELGVSFLSDTAILVSEGQAGQMILFASKRGGQPLSPLERATLYRIVESSDLVRSKGLKIQIGKSDVHPNFYEPSVRNEDNYSQPQFKTPVQGISEKLSMQEIQVLSTVHHEGQKWIVRSKNYATGEVLLVRNEGGRRFEARVYAERQYGSKLNDASVPYEFGALIQDKVLQIPGEGQWRVIDVDRRLGKATLRKVGSSGEKTVFAKTLDAPQKVNEARRKSADQKFNEARDEVLQELLAERKPVKIEDIDEDLLEFMDPSQLESLFDEDQASLLAAESRMVRSMAESLRARGVEVEVISGENGGIALRIPPGQDLTRIQDAPALTQMLTFLNKRPYQSNESPNRSGRSTRVPSQKKGAEELPNDPRFGIRYDPTSLRQRGFLGAVSRQNQEVILGVGWTLENLRALSGNDVHEGGHVGLMKAISHNVGVKSGTAERGIFFGVEKAGTKLPSGAISDGAYSSFRQMDEVEVRFMVVAAHLAGLKPKSPKTLHVTEDVASRALAETSRLVSADLKDLKATYEFLKDRADFKIEPEPTLAWDQPDGSRWLMLDIETLIPGGTTNLLWEKRSYGNFKAQFRGIKWKVPERLRSLSDQEAVRSAFISGSNPAKQARQIILSQIKSKIAERSAISSALEKVLGPEIQIDPSKVRYSSDQMRAAMKAIRIAQSSYRSQSKKSESNLNTSVRDYRIVE